MYPLPLDRLCTYLDVHSEPNLRSWSICISSNNNKKVGKCTTVGAGIGGKSRGSARADDNQPKSGNNIRGNGGSGSGGRDSGSHGSGSDNGDGNNGSNVGGNTAAMAAVMAAPTVAEGAADVGGGHLSNYCITVRTDVIKFVRRMAKHSCVLWQNTLGFCLAKHFNVLQNIKSVGPLC